MLRSPRAFLLGALICLPALASAKESWKDLREQYDAARKRVAESLDEDLPKDEEKLKAHLEELKKAKDGLKALPAKMLEKDGKKTVDYLIEQSLLSEVPGVATGALLNLRRVKDRKAVRQLVKETDRAKDPRIANLLTEVLADVKDPGAGTALLKAIKDRDDRRRAAAARAIGKRGDKDLAKSLKRLLRDDSLVVRYAAANAIEKLSGKRPDGFPKAQAGDYGLPDRFNCDRVVFLVDVTKEALEADFEDPLAEAEEEKEGEEGGQEKKGDEKKAAEKKKEQAPPVSPHQLVTEAVSQAVGRLSEDSRFHLSLFSGSSQSYAKGYGKGGKKVVDGVRSFLKGARTRSRDRRLDAALSEALALEPRPDVIYVFLAGAPTYRTRVANDRTLGEAQRNLWGRGIQVNVVRFVAPPAQQPRTEGARALQQAYEDAFGKFTNDLASMSGGAEVRIDLTRRVEKSKDDAKDDEPALDVDLTQAIDRRARKKVETYFEGLLEQTEERDPTNDELKLIEDLAGCPDPKVAAPIALDLLLKGSPAVSATAARGLAANKEPRVHAEAVKRFVRERTPAGRIKLIKAIGPAANPAVTGALITGLGRLDGDQARVAWRMLAARPADELKPQKGKLTRLAKGLEGLSRAYANEALAKAAGRPMPPRNGLEIAEGHFLPERFRSKGVAIIVDSSQKMGEAFAHVPKAKPKEDGKNKKKKRKRGRKGEEKKDDAKKPETEPVSLFKAVQSEVSRAIEAVGKAEGRANVFTTGGRSWKSSAEQLGPGAGAQIGQWLENQRLGNQRDIWKPLQRALNDRAVEQIYLIVSGRPIRTPGARDVKDLLERVRNLNQDRDVSIDVIYVLPPEAKEAMAQARRQDELSSLDALYSPLTGNNRGKVVIRTKLATLAPKKAP